MPVRVTIDVIQAPPMAFVAQSYFLTRERYEDLLDPTYEAVDLIRAQIKENFESESSGGEKWPEWSFWYRQKRGQKDKINPMGEEYKTSSGVFAWRATTTSQKILQLSGTLVSVATDVAAWDVDLQGNAAAAVMEGVPSYGFAHITGSDLVHLPARDWSFLPDDVLDDIDEKFFEHFDEPME